MKLIKNPNKCRYIMFILIVYNLVLALLSRIIFRIKYIHHIFIEGVFITFGLIFFGILAICCKFGYC